MKKFTVILLSFSFFVKAALSSPLVICNGTSDPVWSSVTKGIIMALEEKGEQYTFSKECFYSFSYGNETFSLKDVLPDEEEEVKGIEGLVEGETLAILYEERFADIAEKLKEAFSDKEILVIHTVEELKGKYKTLVDELIRLNEEEKKIDTLIFLGSYREALIFVPFFRVFHPSPKVVGSWRMASNLMFSYRRFMGKVIFFDYYLPWEADVSVRGFVLKYRKRYSQMPNRFSFLGYSFIKNGFRRALSYKIIKVRTLPYLVPPFGSLEATR